MKVFRYERGHVAGKTITVAELRDLLSSYPPEMPVFAEWEGVHGYVDPEMVATENLNKGMVEDDCDCLIIDVGRY